MEEDKRRGQSCGDLIRFKVVTKAGRAEFRQVRLAPGQSCDDGMAEIVRMLEGSGLHEVELRKIESIRCDHRPECASEVADVVRELRDILPEPRS